MTGALAPFSYLVVIIHLQILFLIFIKESVAFEWQMQTFKVSTKHQDECYTNWYTEAYALKLFYTVTHATV